MLFYSADGILLQKVPPHHKYLYKYYSIVFLKCKYFVLAFGNLWKPSCDCRNRLVSTGGISYTYNCGDNRLTAETFPEDTAFEFANGNIKNYERTH